LSAGCSGFADAALSHGMASAGKRMVAVIRNPNPAKCGCIALFCSGLRPGPMRAQLSQEETLSESGWIKKPEFDTGAGEVFPTPHLICERWILLPRPALRGYGFASQ
jgi:hypothetical protein